MKSRIKFGTDGWRAVMGEGFTEENLIRVAEAFARSVRSNAASMPRVAVGFDGRKNSPEYARLFAEILSANEIPVLLSPSVIPTPVLSFAVKHHSCTAGVMITASHNPPAYNGVKFKGSYGGPFMSEQTRAVEALVSEAVNGSRTTANIERKDFLPEYLRHIATMIDVDVLRRFAERPANNASVLIDSMGGAGGTILEDILVPLGWRAQTIFGAPEPGFYGRSPEPIEKNLGPMLYNTAVTDALLGIATDGDADRCSIAYEDGTWMTAQENILALVWHLHTNKKWTGAVITSASVTDKVRMLAERWGEKVFDVSVGFKYITEVMLREPFMFGAEESGGFGFAGHLPERDGILSGLMFCEMIASTGRPLRSIMDEVYSITGTLCYDRIDMEYTGEDRTEILPRLASSGPDRIAGFPVRTVRKYSESDALTGIKFFLGDSRWLLIRTSQTEPLVRIYAEGESNEEVRTLLAEGEGLVTRR